MKTLLFLLLLCLPCFAGRVTIAFDDPNPPAEVAGYALELKPEGGAWDWYLSFTGTQVSLTNLTPGKYSLRIYAVGFDGTNSDYSGEVSVNILKAPLNLHIVPTKTVSLEMSEDMKKWEPLVTLNVPDSDRVFLRLSFGE